MLTNGPFILMLANLYHQIAMALQNIQPALAQQYENASQFFMGLLRARGVGA